MSLSYLLSLCVCAFYAFCRQNPKLQQQQNCLPERTRCDTLFDYFLARDDTVLFLHSNNAYHAYQFAHRHLQVVFYAYVVIILFSVFNYSLLASINNRNIYVIYVYSPRR